MRLALVFGGSGSIGQSICENFTEQGSRVVGAGRTNNPHNEIIEWVTWTGDDKQFCQNLKELLIESKIDCVIWAQGMNCNDDIDDFDMVKLKYSSSRVNESGEILKKEYFHTKECELKENIFKYLSLIIKDYKSEIERKIKLT